MDSTEWSRRMLAEATDAVQRKPATTSPEHQQLMQRLLSHLEAGPSTAEAEDPLLQTLRAQKLALSLLHRGVQLPSSLLNKVNLPDAPDQVRLANHRACRPTSANSMITYPCDFARHGPSHSCINVGERACSQSRHC